MAKLKIVTGEDNPILRAVSTPVQKFDASLKKFAKDLKEAMFAANGLGIAAPQVGRNIRVFIVTLALKTKEEQVLAMVNPEILEWGKALEVGEEGCLSLPGAYGKVARAKRVKVQFFDVEGNRQILDLAGLDARVVQHELDHLNGVLFIDKLAKGEKQENLLV